MQKEIYEAWENFNSNLLHFIKAKRDKRNKTGEGGGRSCALDEADDLIYQIIGKESPVLDGLDVPESSGTSSAEIEINPNNSGVNEDPESESEAVKRKKPGVKQGRAQALGVLNDIKKQRYEEQVELCKREKRIRELEIFEREKRLGLGPSEYSVSLHQQLGKSKKTEFYFELNFNCCTIFICVPVVQIAGTANDPIDLDQH